MTARLGAAALLLALALGARAGEERGWRQTLSPHFLVYHENNWLPPGFLLAVERIHSRLRLDLAMFSPWMAKERIKLYLYAGPDSYAKGTFHPPAWSNGLALYERRTVVVYDEEPRRKLDEVLAHETTHLLFESYWGEVGKRPPSWLNEGLAMLEEDAPDHPERSDWYQLMTQLPGQKIYSLESLAKVTPTEDLKNKGTVTTWYAESYSMVFFLFRKHSPLQFKTFVTDLRDGKTLEESLWLVYRFRSTADFEKAWAAWLRAPEHRKRLETASRDASEDPRDAEGASSRRGIGAIPGFKPLRPTLLKPMSAVGAKAQAEEPAPDAGGDDDGAQKPKKPGIGAIDGFKPLQGGR